jgi:hypothetical protein
VCLLATSAAPVWRSVLAAVASFVVCHRERRRHQRWSHSKRSRWVKSRLIHRWRVRRVIDVASWVQLSQSALLMVHRCGEGVGEYRKHALKVVRLDVLRAELERVAGVVVERTEVQELANASATVGIQAEVVLLERVEASEEILDVWLR